MLQVKKYFYVLGIVLLVVILFFKNNIPLRIADNLWIISGILLFLIILSEIFTRKKK